MVFAIVCPTVRYQRFEQVTAIADKQAVADATDLKTSQLHANSAIRNAAEIARDTSATVTPHSELGAWRRTKHGWERVSTWSRPRRRTQLPAATRLHPGLLASLQLLISLGGLLAFSSRN